MTTFNFNDVLNGTTTRTDTQVTTVGAGGVYTYTFTGTGFGTGTGFPSFQGTITGLHIVGTDGTDLTMSGFSESVSDLESTLLFGGSWTDVENNILGGNDTINGSTQSDNVFGYTGADKFNMARGGNDVVLGQDGNDTFNFGAKFTSQDQIDGGNNNDKLVLNGDYSGGVTFNATTMLNVESVNLTGGHSYKLTTNDATVAAGKTLTVNGTDLGTTDKLTFNGSSELDGKFVIRGGAGADVLTGGKGNDSFTGGLGADKITGGLGKDYFVYTAVSESTGTKHDVLTGFDFNSDRIDLTVAVTGINAAASGALNTATLNQDFASALDGTHLGAHQAVLFTASSGTLSGTQFLVVDANGTAGYQANQDFVFELNAPLHTAALSTLDFI
jgi:Ca2+-binding RTX toxin-like protein